MEILIHKILARLSAFLEMNELRVLDALIHERLIQLGSDPVEQANYSYWERQSHSWRQTVSPVRPSEGDIKIYERFLKEKGNVKRILILGSTPELREMVARETDATIYVADESFSMLAGMLKFAPHVDPLKEKWIKDDWLVLPLPAKFFDVILGDVVLHQVAPKREHAFLQHMLFLLQDEGVFITRLFFLDKEFFEKDIDSIVRNIYSSNYSATEKRTLITLQVLWLYADLAARKLNRPRSAEAFDCYARERKMKDPILENVRDVLTADEHLYRSWSPPDEKDLLKMVSSAFFIQDRRIAEDYQVAHYFPVVLLSPRR